MLSIVIAVDDWIALVHIDNVCSILLFMFLMIMELPLNQKTIDKIILFWNSYSCRWKLTLDSILLDLLDVDLRKMIVMRC